MALYPGRSRWAGSRWNIHSLTSCLCGCGYYTTSVINFLHFLLIFLAYLSDLTIFFFDLTPSFLWPASRSYTFHFKIHAFFTQSFSSFLKTFPYHLNLCHCISVIISSIPSLSFNSLLENLSVNMAPHIHPPNHFHLSPVDSFSLFTGHILLPCNMQLCTQFLYNLILIRSETSLLVSRGTSCLNLLLSICTLASTTASASSLHSTRYPEHIH